MILTIDKRTVSRCVDALQCLKAMGDDKTDAVCAGRLRRSFGEPSTVIRYPAGPVSSYSLIATFSENITVVVVGGAGVRTFANVLAGYGGRAAMTGANGMNTAAALEYLTRFQGVLSSGIFRGRRIFAYGYSGGGLVVESLRQAAANGRIAGVESVVTFGSPKRGLAGKRSEGSSESHGRFVVVGDPIPSVPFSNLVGGSELTESLLAERGLWDDCVQSDDGIVVSQGTEDTTLGRRLLSPGESAAEIRGWLVNRATPQRVAHSVFNYLREFSRLQSSLDEDERKRALEALATGGRLSTPPLGANLVREFMLVNPPIGSGARNPATVAVASAIYPTRERGSSMARIFVPITLRPKQEVVAGKYVVTWMGEVLGNFPTQSKARTWAKGLYRGARTMLAASSVDAAATTAAWATFIQAAATSGSGIRPTINVI